MNQLSLTYEPELTNEQRAVWGVIRARQGRAAAIPMPVVALLAYDNKQATRRVQTIVKELIEAGMPIGSSSAKPNNGYWVLATAEEYDAADANLEHRIMALSQRRKNLRRHRARLAGQQELNHGIPL